MTGQELLDLMAFVEPKYIEEAEAFPIRKKAAWKRWGILAACLCLLLGGAYAGRKYVSFGLKMIWSHFSPDTDAILNLPPPPNFPPASYRFSSVEQFVLVKRSGELDHLLPDLEHFYLLEDEFEGFELDRVDVSKNRIDFHYTEIIDASSNTCEVILPNSSNRTTYEKNAPLVPKTAVFSQYPKDENLSLARVAEQFGTKVYYKKGFYALHEDKVFFESEDFLFSIASAYHTDENNYGDHITRNYSKIMNYRSVRKASFAEYDLQEYFAQLSVEYQDPNSNVSILCWEEYELFLSYQDSSFISYEQLKALGEFYGFYRSFYVNGEVCYVYKFKDAEGTRITLCFSRNGIVEEGLQRLPYLSPPSDKDFRKIFTKEDVCIKYRGITYNYYKQCLDKIVWEQDGVFFWLYLENIIPNQKTIDKTTLLGKLFVGEVELPVFPAE